MHLRNWIVVAAAMMACQLEVVAAPGEPIEDVSVGLGKQPHPNSLVVQHTNANGRVQFVVDTAGTYQISVRYIGIIPGLVVGSPVQLSGNVRALPQVNVPATTLAAVALAVPPVSSPLVTGSMVLNPNANQSQLLALGTQSNVSDTLIDEEITLSAPAILDLQFTRANDPLPTTGMTFLTTEGARSTLAQTLPINVSDVGGIMTVTASGTAFNVTVSSPVATITPQGPPPNIQVTAFPPGNLPPGLYSVSLNMSFSGGTPPTTSNRTVPVYLMVFKNKIDLPPAVDKISLMFTAAPGGTAPPQAIHLSNLGTASDRYTINFLNVADAQNLSINLTSVTLGAGESVDVTVQPRPAAFLSPGVQDVRISIARQQSAIPQVVDVTLIAAPVNCRASRLIPMVVAAPNAIVGALPAIVSIQVSDDCGNLAYNSTVTGSVDGSTVCKTKINGSRSNIKTNLASVVVPPNPSNPALTLTVVGLDTSGNLLSGSSSIAFSPQSAPNVRVVRDVGVLARSNDYLSTDSLNTVAPEGFAPGQSITVTGDNLADDRQSADSSSALPTTLAGSQLKLDGQPIPLIQVAAHHIDAVIPFDVTPGYHQLVLVNLAGTTPPYALPPIFITPAAPEVVSKNSSETGPASLFKFKKNGNLVKVSADNPAVAGDKIQFSATGLGAVSPAVAAGTFIPPNDTTHKITSPITLTIGDVEAQVTSAWLDSGNQGAYVVEAMVPTGLSYQSGGVTSLPLALSVPIEHCPCPIPMKSWIYRVTGSFQTQPVTTVTMGFSTSPYDGLTLSVNGTQYVTPPYPGIVRQFPIGALVNVQVSTPQFLGSNTKTRYALSSGGPINDVLPAADMQFNYAFVPEYKWTLIAPAGGSLTANPPGSGGYYRQSVSGALSSVTLTGACGPLQQFVAFNIQQANALTDCCDAPPIQSTLNPTTVAVNAPTTVTVNCTDPPTWTLTNPLKLGRYGAGATLLPSGKVIVAGGYGPTRPLTVEIYDPATETWSNTTPLPAAHASNAIRLLTGEVLVVGDEGSIGEPAHLFNETGATWTATGVPNVRRFATATALLASGDVLMVGGYNGGCCYGDAGNYETAEIYNRSSNTWTPTGSMATKRAGFTATILPSGKVLAAGGFYRDTEAIRNSAEIYDPLTKAWSPAPAMLYARSAHTATVLPSGQVLVVGGYYTSLSDFTPTAELYNPATGTWTSTGSLATARAAHTATLLPSGKVLVTGGYNSSGILTSSEVYDPVTSQWTAGPNLINGRARATATLLSNGKVLAVGGHDPSNGVVFTSAELYH